MTDTEMLEAAQRAVARIDLPELTSVQVLAIRAHLATLTPREAGRSLVG